ncbi:MAG: CarD family transcriptional regulator [Lachnospiraceae bacterium]|nr:CarD family transcriptional regulator [Lachnospiraceae bacterium]
MYKVGDYVMTANNGVCEIKDITTMDSMSNSKGTQFCVLVPVTEQTAKVYIPEDRMDTRCRNVVDPDEMKHFIDEIPTIETEDIKSDKERELMYKDVIQSCDIKKMIAVLKNMNKRKQARLAMGKKNIAMEERYQKIIEKNLFSECAFVLNKSADEVKELFVTCEQ